MPDLLVIADDLTGSLDSTAGFARAGKSVRVALTPMSAGAALKSGADIVAVSTNSRECPSAEVHRLFDALETALERRKPHLGFFKKIDSRLKGHIGLEVARLRHVDQPVILCPAIPKLGRIVANGQLCGEGVDQPIDVATTCGLSDVETPDASSDADLDEIVEKAPAGCLFVGAAGLAEALARRLGSGSSTAPPLPVPVLVAIGSRDPVTLKQIEGLKFEAVPNGSISQPETPRQHLHVLRMTPGPSPVDATRAAEDFAEGLSVVVRHSQTATLVASGGETAGAVLRRLGVETLEVLGEALPGLPVSRATWPRELTVVTKSGGFGGPETMKELLATIDEVREHGCGG